MRLEASVLESCSGGHELEQLRIAIEQKQEAMEQETAIFIDFYAPNAQYY
jgi:hypothetical protein